MERHVDNTDHISCHHIEDERAAGNKLFTKFKRGPVDITYEKADKDQVHFKKCNGKCRICPWMLNVKQISCFNNEEVEQVLHVQQTALTPKKGAPCKTKYGLYLEICLRPGHGHVSYGGHFTNMIAKRRLHNHVTACQPTSPHYGDCGASHFRKFLLASRIPKVDVVWKLKATDNEVDWKLYKRSEDCQESDCNVNCSCFGYRRFILVDYIDVDEKKLQGPDGPKYQQQILQQLAKGEEKLVVVTGSYSHFEGGLNVRQTGGFEALTRAA